MSESHDKLLQLLQEFDLTKDEGKVFIDLYKKGERTALQLSRDLKIARTKIYRIVEKLSEIGLIEEIVREKGKSFKAADKSRFELILKDREHDLEKLRDSTRSILGELSSFQSSGEEASEIRQYKGIDGLKQMTWNSLKTEGELLIFEISEMSEFLDFGFAEKVRMEFVNREVKVRELTNQKKFGAWTKIEPLVEKYWDCRYIPKEFLEMEMEILIYNDIYAIYGYRGEEIFGVEIQNKQVADMQRQIFESFWSRGEKMKIGKGGAAEVV